MSVNAREISLCDIFRPSLWLCLANCYHRLRIVTICCFCHFQCYLHFVVLWLNEKISAGIKIVSKTLTGRLIGIGGRLAASPLPHHRAYGSVPRRFDRLKPEQEHRGGEDRGRRNTGCAEPVGRPDVLTCARNRSASRQQPPRGTSAGHAVAVL